MPTAWADAKSPVLQMFHWNRIIVDEFTYLDNQDHTSIISLESSNKWVLSGTPPLGDFQDVKTIAVFLGINLGVDDDTVGATKAENVKALRKELTAVEQFQAFREYRSSAWHEHRHDIAQNFLDQFVRQNIAEIDEIKSVQLVQAVHLPAAERALYLELSHYLAAQDTVMRNAKSGGRLEGDRNTRLRKALHNAKSHEEALLKCCSHFDLGAQTTANAMKACDVLVKLRKDDLKDLLVDFRKQIKQSTALAHKLASEYDGSICYHYQTFLDQSKNNNFGDDDTNGKIAGLLQKAEARWTENDIYEFFVEVPLGETLPKKKAATKKKGKAKAGDGEVESSEEDGDTRAHMPENENKTVATLRLLQYTLRRSTRELTGRVRSLRFFGMVRDLQTGRSEADMDDSMPSDKDCESCGRKNLPFKDVAMISMCGHHGCLDCITKAANLSRCVVERCDTQPRPMHIIEATKLGEDDFKVGDGKRYGQKLEQILELIQDRIPKDEKIIIFVQFEELMFKLKEILDDHRVGYNHVTGTAHHRSKELLAFQGGSTSGGKRVLLLTVMDESAAGA